MRATNGFKVLRDALMALGLSSLLVMVGMSVVAWAVSVGEAKVYYLKNHYTGENFFTLDAHEKDILSQEGWAYEGVSWIAPAYSDTAVYRLYNPYNDDHLYTVDYGEYQTLPSYGWAQEGVKFYSDDVQSLPIYRMYDPTRTDAGAHRYTTSSFEHEASVFEGWVPEGAKWYGLRLPSDAEGGGWQAPIELARQLLGVPYVSGGASPQVGFDCSGLVYYVYNQLGCDLQAKGLRTTYQLINYLRLTDSWTANVEDLDPGDIVFTHAGHVGIYVGLVDDVHMMIDAPTPGDVVSERPVYSLYYGGSILGGGSLR